MNILKVNGGYKVVKGKKYRWTHAGKQYTGIYQYAFGQFHIFRSRNAYWWLTEQHIADIEQLNK